MGSRLERRGGGATSGRTVVFAVTAAADGVEPSGTGGGGIRVAFGGGIVTGTSFLASSGAGRALKVNNCIKERLPDGTAVAGRCGFVFSAAGGGVAANVASLMLT